MRAPTHLPPWLWPRAAYIHVPFCAHHCGYCDFAVAAGQDHLIDLYIEALGTELARLDAPTPVQTLFLGGGTPTHLSAEQLDRLLANIHQWLLLPPGGEFTVEANPDSVTADKVEVLANYGVNRVSLGVQSFQPALLPRLDRRHVPGHVGPAIDQVRRQIDNLSLDLIFGVPGQTLEQWDADLTAALAFAPDHISTYGLTYEKGTPLWKRRERGEVNPVSEDDELAMYVRTMDRLAGAGLEQYEVSNFARPGRRCRHNETYWANEAYFGFGVGAARYVMKQRELNRRNTAEYIRRVLAGESATFQSEELPPEDAARETAATQLRRSAGVIRSRFHEQTGHAFDDLTRGRAEHLVALELLEDDADAVRLTRRGRCVADGVIVNLVWGTNGQSRAGRASAGD